MFARFKLTAPPAVHPQPEAEALLRCGHPQAPALSWPRLIGHPQAAALSCGHSSLCSSRALTVPGCWNNTRSVLHSSLGTYGVWLCWNNTRSVLTTPNSGTMSAHGV